MRKRSASRSSSPANRAARSAALHPKGRQPPAQTDGGPQTSSPNATEWLQRGDSLLGHNQYEDALEAFNSAVALAPQDSTAWHKRGYALSNLGRYTEAVADYERALTLSSDDAAVWANQGYALSKLGQNERALAAYNRALALDSDLAQAWVGKAGALYELGRYCEAVTASEEAVRLEPSEPVAITWLRQAYAAVHRSAPDRGMRLSDGRWLAYIDYGDPHGTPVLACHGTPGSRLDFPMDYPAHEAPLHRLHVRLIVPDRPGYGRSDLPPHFKVLDWPADMEQLLDHLGLARCAVLGVSGGGAYAAACAYTLPHCVNRLGLVSSVAPASAPEVAKGLPRFQRWQVQSPLFRWATLPYLRMASWQRARTIRISPEVWHYYKVHVDSSGRWRAFRRALGQLGQVPPPPPTTIERLLEPFRGGSKGYARDVWLGNQEWGFQLSAINTPTYLWHGEQDRRVPLVMGQHLARTIPHCQARFYAEEGHSLLTAHWDEVLATLVA